MPTRSIRCWRCRPRKRRSHCRHPGRARSARTGTHPSANSDFIARLRGTWIPDRALRRVRDDRGGITMLRAVARAAAIVFVLVCGAPAQAQYPNRPVTIIVSLAAGSGMDVLVRLYADKLSQALGKPVIVENRPGASLMLAANAVANAPPDGHTLLVSTSSAMAINLTLFRQVTYDPDRDFVPLSLYAH